MSTTGEPHTGGVHAGADEPAAGAAAGMDAASQVVGISYGDEESAAAARASQEPEEQPDGGEVADLSGDRLGALAAERDEYLDALRRVQADFENFRKQAGRRQSETLERAGQSLATALLPVLDAMDLAVAHHGAPGGSGESGRGEDDGGIGRIASMLFDVLGKEGLERVGKVGEQFDPAVHDAVAHEAASSGGGDDDDLGTGSGAQGAGEPVHPTVVEVLRSGYLWKGRLVRPAMVKVRG